jgi:hypothetical protein
LTSDLLPKNFISREFANLQALMLDRRLARTIRGSPFQKPRPGPEKEIARRL